LPLEATEKAILNEKDRTASFDEMERRSQEHQKVEAEFDQWSKDLKDNTPAMEEALDEGWNTHRAGMVASGRWLANGHDGEKMDEEATFQGLDMVVGEDVQIKSVKGDASNKDVGFIGSLDCGKPLKAKGQSCRNEATGTVDFQKAGSDEKAEVYLTELAAPGAVKIADIDSEADPELQHVALENYKRLKDHLEKQRASYVTDTGKRRSIKAQIDKIDASVNLIEDMMNQKEEAEKELAKAAAEAPASEAPVDEE